jgi:hypothetical protein
MHEINLNIILISAYLQFLKVNFESPLNTFAFYLTIFVLMEYLVFHLFMAFQILKKFKEENDIIQQIDQYGPILDDIDYNKVV